MASTEKPWLSRLIVLSLLAWTTLAHPAHGPSAPSWRLKRTDGLCETTEGVKSYAGYVNIPPTSFGSSDPPRGPHNIFFWFFESRKDPETAPLTIWLQGGPGSGSIDQALGGNGPCRVLNDSKSTELNEWSWNQDSNVLYIDQPISSGFSFDIPTPGKLDLLSGGIFSQWYPSPSRPTVNGTFSSQNALAIPLTSEYTAAILWEFMQSWMVQPQFRSYRRESVSLWTQSYGGHWGPAIAHMFTRRSLDLKSRGASPPRSCGHAPTQPRPIAISHLGIFSGLVDYLVQGEYLPEFAVNNTYGIQAYPPKVADKINAAFGASGGCKELVVTCQDLATSADPYNTGTNTDVQNACLAAFEVCLDDVQAPFETLSTLSPYDIAQNRSAQFPEPFAYGFLNREEIQQRLGVDIRGGHGVNYTFSNPSLPGLFAASGDLLRKDFRFKLGELLDHGIPVTLAYGDRDYGANWFGGEALTKSIPFNASASFLSAGYQDFLVQESVAGKTRQAGLLSFTRIFQAGHAIPFYNPPATYALFRRVMLNTDIPRGLLPASAADTSFSTSGPNSIRHLTQAAGPVRGSTFCYVLAPPLVLGQCSAEQLAGLQDGSAPVVDFIVQ